MMSYPINWIVYHATLYIWSCRKPNAYHWKLIFVFCFFLSHIFGLVKNFSNILAFYWQTIIVIMEQPLVINLKHWRGCFIIERWYFIFWKPCHWMNWLLSHNQCYWILWTWQTMEYFRGQFSAFTFEQWFLFWKICYCTNNYMICFKCHWDGYKRLIHLGNEIQFSKPKWPSCLMVNIVS